MLILQNMAAKIKQGRHRNNLRQPKELQAAIDCGIDVSALIENLKRTPAERIRRHQIALNTLQKLREAKQKKR